MARKSVAARKKDAKQRVRGVDNPFEPTSRPNTIAFLILEGAKLGAEILIDRDPLNIIQPMPGGGGGDFGSPSVPSTPENLRVLFDAQPNPEQAYNDARDLAAINQDQELENALAKLSKTRPTQFKKKPARTGYGSGRFQSQFGQNMGFNYSQLSKPKRKRSKSMKAADKKLSKAFKQANATCRKKNGQFKKGKCQADVAKMAHRLRKKM